MSANGDGVSVWGDGCTTLGVNLMPLDCALENAQGGHYPDTCDCICHLPTHSPLTFCLLTQPQFCSWQHCQANGASSQSASFLGMAIGTIMVDDTLVDVSGKVLASLLKGDRHG